MTTLGPFHRHPSRSKARGFTLIESLVSIAILAVLAALAAPSFTQSIKRYRIVAVRDDLMSSIQFARTEAIRRGVAVSLSRTSTCSPATANDWDCGWEVFVDRNANGTRDANATPALDDTLLQTSVAPTGYSITQPANGSSITANVWGQTTTRKFLIYPTADGVSNAATTTICINSGGRIRKLSGDATCP